jgi:undecaprenyl pyrophosphate phosphatase UppP
MNPTQVVQILVLALVQGITELFPISSLGHTVLLPGLLGWNTTLQDPNFVAVLVLLHLGTATALLTFFWRESWKYPSYLRHSTVLSLSLRHWGESWQVSLRISACGF